MHTYRTEIQIDATPEAVFEYVTDFSNMNDYLPTVHRAEPAGEGKIRMWGEANGHPYEGEGWFDKDDATCTMSWGSDGESAYSGHLTVREFMGHSLLELMLNFGAMPGDEAGFEERMQERGPMIQEGLEKAAQKIQAQVEGVRLKDGAYVA